MIGVGIGGTFDKAALLAKKALLSPAQEPNNDPYYAQMEAGLSGTDRPALGIGPQGFGGKTTALVGSEHPNGTDPISGGAAGGGQRQLSRQQT